MTVEFPALALILLFPAIGVVFNLFLGARWGRTAVNVVGPGVMFAAFGVATWAFLTLLAMPAGGALEMHLWGWIEAGRFHADLGLRVDALSGVMVMIVTGVGALIHLYSVGYMAHDEDFARFFTYMNLFALSMLILILADNLLMMFVGWEGVGLCRYLLIAFWYTNPQYAYNGRKAFVVNRIGDAGFLLGMFTIVATLGAHGVWTLNFVELRNNAALMGGAAATAACFLLFIGATGKSAQIPLYVWLPDAMVGPTPVSALIHAATMVTAGVYMIARLRIYVHDGAEHARPGSDDWRRHSDVCGEYRDRPARHQESARLLDHQPARLHVSRRRFGRVCVGHLSRHDARVLQGPAVPVRGFGHSRARRRAGHEQDGRAAPASCRSRS